ncbi:MAG: hypothetical protein KA314_16890 [Chloroflexi bacterium]|nr:hypothetical protein [Chloroflexota bacterium]MBP8057509.1 hypothetical protein [Chloroflexota bacterium]
MSQFSGLTMPVFSAFGWAGQETAVKYAMSQLELFISRLHAALPQELQGLMPHFGVDAESQIVYIASGAQLEPEPYLTFQARPLSFEMTLHITDEMYVGKMLSVAERQFDSWYTAVKQLGESWHLRIQQMEVIEGGHPSHYQDLYKGPVIELEREAANEITNRAIYLHGEEKWVTPIYFSLRLHSELVAAMGLGVIPTIRDHVMQLMPLLQFVHVLRKSSASGRTPKAAKTRAPRPAAAPIPAPITRTVTTEAGGEGKGQREQLFHFVSELKPLHLRKGFVNLLPQHWPYFAISTRTETRPIVVRYGSKRDEESSAWHLMPDDQTRIVLGPTSKVWLEDNFVANDMVDVTAYRLGENGVEVVLQAPES